MANHQVKVQTMDGNPGAELNPASLSAQPGDQITFESQHQGRLAPQKINIAISSGNICSPANPSVLLSSLSVPGNNSMTVMMSTSAQAGTVAYQLAGMETAGMGSKTSMPGTNAAMTGDPEPVLGDDG